MSGEASRRRTAPARLAWAVALAALLGAAAARADDALRWFEAGRPGPQARQAIELLLAAPSHGLEPRDYDAEGLRRALEAAAATPPGAEQAARLDQALSTAVERYLGDLHQGRVDPQRLRFRFATPSERFDPAAVLAEALASNRLQQAAAQAAPQVSPYEPLRQQLALHRQLLDHPAWQRALAPLPAGAKGKAARLDPGGTTRAPNCWRCG